MFRSQFKSNRPRFEIWNNHKELMSFLLSLLFAFYLNTIGHTEECFDKESGWSTNCPSDLPLTFKMIFLAINFIFFNIKKI